MKERVKTWTWRLASALGVVVMAVGVYPGVLADSLALMAFLAVMLAVFWIPALVVAISYWASAEGVKDAPDDDFGPAATSSRKGSRWIAVAVLISTVVMAATGRPRHAAFAASRPAFERFVAASPTLDEFDVETRPLGRWLGAYYVDEYAVDGRGGVYFRTYAGLDGLGPDTMSHGFAFRPDRERTPFGGTHYQLMPMGDDWYEFAASNDY